MVSDPEPTLVNETEPEPEPTPLESPAPAEVGITLGEALEQFVDHKLTTGKWTISTQRDMQARMNGIPVDSVW